MPKYTFVCHGCGREYTVSTPWSEKEKAACPGCGSLDKQQQYRPVGIIGGSACPSYGSGEACPISGAG